jgi:hypothetical protein
VAFCPTCYYECSNIELGFTDESVFSCPVDECPVELFRLVEGVNDYETVQNKDSKDTGDESGN